MPRDDFAGVGLTLGNGACGILSLGSRFVDAFTAKECLPVGFALGSEDVTWGVSSSLLGSRGRKTPVGVVPRLMCLDADLFFIIPCVEGVD